MKPLRPILATVSALSLLAAPATLAAQDAEETVDMAEGAPAGEMAGEEYSDDKMAEAMAMLGQMFPAEPLTPEQEARLPQAARIINRMIPEGTMGEMMGSMFDNVLGPIMQLADAPAMAALSKGTGLPAYALDLDPEAAAEAALLFDPAYAERHAREAAVMPEMMRDMMTAMEPTMRKAMSELYAFHFTDAELDGIEAFFQTDIGTAYARKSFTLSSDPRIISASMEAMPAMMQSFAAMEQKIAAASEGLPPRRNFAELTPAEQAKVAELTGYSVEEIQAEAANSDDALEAEDLAAESD